MISKEALKNICSNCEIEKAKNKVRCPFRSISNEYCDEYMKIEKDLEVLKILKKYLFVNRLTLATTQSIGIGFLDSKNQIDDFKIIKEWLEDDN